MEDRFWSKVGPKDPKTGCAEWQAKRDAHGYGYFCAGTRPKGGGLMRRAHRVAWELTNGPIPDGLVIRHKCDNPSCVNPGHLETGTQAENMRDMHERGRNRGGRKAA